MLRRVFLICAAIVVLLAFAACTDGGNGGAPPVQQRAEPEASPGGQPDDEAVTAALSEITVGISLMTLEHVFFQQIRDGFEAAAQQLGVRLIIMDARSQLDVQFTQVQDFITQGVDAIVLAPVSVAGTSTMVERATDAGIPVFSLDNRSDGEVVSHVATDNYLGGRLAGQWVMENLLPDGGRMVIISMPGTETGLMREAGFIDYLTENNSQIEILGINNGEGAADVALAVMQDFITLFGDDIDAVYSVTDGMAIGAMSAIQAADQDISIIGFGANPHGVAAIAEGGVFKASVRQDPDAITYTALQSIVSHLGGEPIDSEHLIAPTVVYAANVDNYLEP